MNPKDIFTRRNILYGVGALAIVVLAVFLLVGNGEREEDGLVPIDFTVIDPNEGASTISAESRPYVPPIEIEGAKFRLASYMNSAIPAGGEYTLAFGEGNLSAKFCNSMSGAYTLANGVVRASLASTKKFCGEPAGLMGIETAFGSVLASGASFYVEGNTITIRGSNGEKFFFEAVR